MKILYFHNSVVASRHNVHQILIYYEVNYDNWINMQLHGYSSSPNLHVLQIYLVFCQVSATVVLLALKPVRAGCRVDTQNVFVPPIGERLNTHSDFCEFCRLTCQHANRGVT